MRAAKLTGAQILARTLALAGVREAFTIAGDHVLPILDEMADGDFRLIDNRHEQAAAHMADTWARITGKPGVVIATTPGFANVVPGLANAVHTEGPLLSIGGSAELAELGRGAMQEIDQIGMARPVTKLSEMVTDARRIPDTVARALRLAYAGRRGPVHLTLPLDLQRQAVPAAEVDFSVVTNRHARPVATADLQGVTQVLDLLAAAERPVAIAGGAAAYSRSGEALTRFAEATGTPVLTEGDGRGLIPDDHPWCAGFYDPGLNWAARLVSEADVVVLIGRKQDLVMRYAAPPAVAAAARLVQIDPSAEEIGRNRPVDVGLVGDTDVILGQLADAATGRSWDAREEWRGRLAAERQGMDAWLETLDQDTQPMHGMAIFKELRPLLAKGDSIVFEGGDFGHFGRAYIGAYIPLSWSYFSTFGMLGSGLPTALAMKLARPETKVVVATGDGAFGFNAFEGWTPRCATASRSRSWSATTPPGALIARSSLACTAAWSRPICCPRATTWWAGAWEPRASTSAGGTSCAPRCRPPSPPTGRRWSTSPFPAPRARARRRPSNAGAPSPPPQMPQIQQF